MIANIEACKNLAERENNMIYFQDVPQGDRLPELPPGAQVMKLSKFEVPGDTTSLIVFVRNAVKPGLFGSLMKAFSSTSVPKAEAVPVAAHVEEARPRSDSEIARDLQHRIDTGAER